MYWWSQVNSCVSIAPDQGLNPFLFTSSLNTNNTWKLANSHLLWFQWWLVWFGWIRLKLVRDPCKKNILILFQMRHFTETHFNIVHQRIGFFFLRERCVQCAISILFALTEPQEHYSVYSVHVECESNSYMKIIVSITFSLQGLGTTVR